MPKPLTLTKAGLDKARQRLAKLEAELTRVLAQKYEAAETGGNVWHDNFAFEELEREEVRIRQQIQELQTTLTDAVVVEEMRETDRVGLGSWVSLRFPDGKTRRFKIVGALQADPSQQLIPQDSPLGAAIIGAAKGETRVFRVGGRETKTTVVVEEIS